MTASKRKPKRAKPVLAWCLLLDGVIYPWQVTCSDERPLPLSPQARAFWAPQKVRLARVEIREVEPQRRKRGGT